MLKCMYKLITVYLFLSVSINLIAQEDNSIDANSLQLLEKAMSPLSGERGVISFHKIAYGIKEPLSIFSLGKDITYQSCYYIFDGRKFEMNLGEMQALSDGRLLVVVNKPAGQIYIDSMRTENPVDKNVGTYSDLTKMFETEFGNSMLNFVGEEVVNGILCKKIKASFSESKDYVLYWVDAEKGTMVLMAENQQNSFVVYWVKEITNNPGNHDFDIHLPKKEIESMYGFTVFDMRYADQNMYKKIKDIK